jgi:thiol-disulfide isomerase/thioredoxin
MNPSNFANMPTRKKCVLILLILLICQSARSQSQFQVFAEKPNEKTYKGIISKEILLGDTSFRWYQDNLKGYSPNAGALAGMKKYADSIQLLAFMGTWCDDSQFIIPKLFMLIDSTGFSMDRITLIGVDRKKRTMGHLAEAFAIVKVPTLIVMKNGKEIGRVLEYGKYGLFDKELGEIINSLDAP